MNFDQLIDEAYLPTPRNHNRLDRLNHYERIVDTLRRYCDAIEQDVIRGDMHTVASKAARMADLARAAAHIKSTLPKEQQ